MFNNQGYDFVEIDLLDTENLAQNLNRVIQNQPVEFAFAFMGYGAGLTVNDKNGQIRNLWEAIGAPFLALFGDSPAYFFDCHVAKSPNFACLYGFPEHQALRRRLPKINGPIGGFQPLLLDPLNRDELDFRQKANGQLLFLKNGNDPGKLWNSWSVLRRRPLRALQDIASHLVANLADEAGNQIDDVITAYFAGDGLDISTLPKLRLFFVAQLDDYLRRFKSTMMAEALMDFPVQIRGVNWEHVDFSGKRVSYVKGCSYAESSSLIRESLGLIDMSPNTGLAPHDRPCRAYGAYTLCVTNEQEFLRRNMPHHAAVSFKFSRESFQEKIADVLEHPARYVDIGIEVASAFREACPPEAAVSQLIDTAAMIRLDQQRERSPDWPGFFVWPPRSLA